jgi:hypothetical protein
MCYKIRYDEKSCKVLGFWVHLNKALVCEKNIRHVSEACREDTNHKNKLYSSLEIYKMKLLSLNNSLLAYLSY